MIEDIVDGPIRLIARLLLAMVRFVIWLTWEMMCERLMWYLGWPVARLLTIGNFPKERFADVDRASMYDHLIVALIGIAYPLILAYVLDLYLSN